MSIDPNTKRLPLDKPEDLNPNELDNPELGPPIPKIQPRWLGRRPDVQARPPRRYYGGWQAAGGPVQGTTGTGEPIAGFATERYSAKAAEQDERETDTPPAGVAAKAIRKLNAGKVGKEPKVDTGEGAPDDTTISQEDGTRA